MIPAPRGLVAQYKHANSDSWSHKDIVAFDDDGYPLIAGWGEHTLVRADTYGNYDGIGRGGEDLIALIPPDGWRIAWKQDDGAEWSQPLVGWGLRADGQVVPLDTDSYGLVEEIDSSHYGKSKYRIYHPDGDTIPDDH